MKFLVHRDADADRTIHEATEQFTVDDIIFALDDFYRSRVPKRLTAS